jgi:hypothetical protein
LEVEHTVLAVLGRALVGVVVAGDVAALDALHAVHLAALAAVPPISPNTRSPESTNPCIREVRLENSPKLKLRDGSQRDKKILWVNAQAGGVPERKTMRVIESFMEGILSGPVRSDRVAFQRLQIGFIYGSLALAVRVGEFGRVTASIPLLAHDVERRIFSPASSRVVGCWRR